MTPDVNIAHIKAPFPLHSFIL